jgi:transcriptional regulator with XRE-family HTH domain
MRRRRERLQLTQEELASRVQLSRASIANAEQGRQALPIHHLVDLAEALETSAAEILQAAEASLSNMPSAVPDDLPQAVVSFLTRNLRGSP